MFGYELTNETGGTPDDDVELSIMGLHDVFNTWGADDSTVWAFSKSNYRYL